MNKRNAKWYRMTPESIIQQLHTDAACGISPKAARSRLKKSGYNTLFDDRKRENYHLRKILIPDSLMILLLVGIVLSLLFLSPFVAILVGVLSVLCGGFYFVLLRKIKKNETNLAKYRIPDVCVLRGRTVLSVSARTVVPGDILILRAGDIVPCDCRLLFSEDVSVLTLMPDEKGIPVYKELPKNSETQYAYGDAYLPPYCENMLYGGSEIVRGSARAVAVETGSNCFLGAMEQFRMPSESKITQSGEESLREFHSYLRVYGFLMLALLIPLSILGVLFAPDILGIPDIFFPICLIAGLASPVLLMLYFRLIALQAPLACMEAEEEKDRAAFKVGGATDKMSFMTDLFLTGHKAFSDGLLHFHSACLGTMRTYPETDADELNRLCETFVILKRAKSEKPGFQLTDAIPDEIFLKELSAYCKYDTDALDIRLIRTAYEKKSGDLECVDTVTKSGSFTLLFSATEGLLEECSHYENRGELEILTAERREELISYFKDARSNACRVRVVARRDEDGILSLVGILALREHIMQDLDKMINELTECGVRSTFFFDGDASYEANFANACNLTGKMLVSSEDLTELSEALLEEYRVFIGFSRDEIATLLGKMQRKRRCVGVLAGSCEDRVLLRDASIVLSCDLMSLHKKGKEDSVRTDPLGGGKEESARAAESVRRRSDVIIPRAGKNGGGLSSIYHAFFECRSVGYKSALLLSYLVPSHMLRIFLAIWFTLFGIGLPGALQILYVGLLIDALALSCILPMKIPHEYLRRPRRIGEKLIGHLIFSKKAWIPLLVSTFVFSLYFAIFSWVGLIDVLSAHTATFVSMLLLSVIVFYQEIYRKKLAYPDSVFKHPAFLLLLPIVLMIPLSVIFPAVGAVTGLGNWRFLSALGIPILPVLYLLMRYFFSFFDGTAK